MGHTYSTGWALNHTTILLEHQLLLLAYQKLVILLLNVFGRIVVVNYIYGGLIVFY